jgi:hypothetical protein
LLSPLRQLNALLPSVLGEIMSYINRFSDDSRKPKLLDQVRLAIRTRHYSIRTEEAYVQWIRRFILFHHKRHPKEMGPTKSVSFYRILLYSVMLLLPPKIRP